MTKIGTLNSQPDSPGSLFALNHRPDCRPEPRGRLQWLEDFFFFFLLLPFHTYSPLSDLSPCLPLLHAPQTRKTAAHFSAIS